MKLALYTIMLTAFLLSNCQGEESKTEARSSAPAVVIDSTVIVEVPQSKPLPPAPPPPVLVSGMDVPAKLDAWMQQVLAAEGSYSNRIQTIQRGQEEHKVMVFSDSEGKVRMVRADISGNKQLGTLQFFLNGGKAVLLREYLPGPQLVENRFYNRQDGQFMDCLSRSIGPGVLADTVAFKPYISKYGFEDFRLKPGYVQKWVDDYLKGK